MTGAPSLLVADSFRVRAEPTTGRAQVRGWSRHLARFSRSVAEVWTAESDLGAALPTFLTDAARRIADFGPGFPRLECWSAPHGCTLALSLRPTPPLGAVLEFRTAPGVTLGHPGRKGPNIDRLAELNRGLGAEALLLDSTGAVLEGATTSVLWWPLGASDGARAGAGGRVPSVTESLLIDAARSSSVVGGLAEARATPDELIGCEVWAVNALHGIRLATAIDGVATEPARADRLRWFTAALERTWEPVLP